MLQRENKEWSNYWWENADDLTTGRVLLIGDSISVGYRNDAQENLPNLCVDLLATSKIVSDPAYRKEVAYFLNEYPYHAIHFNNGLHQLTVDLETYRKSYEEILDLLLSKCSKVILTLSTPITTIDDPQTLSKDNEIVLQRNEIVKEIAKSRQLPLDDLYSVVCAKADCKSMDGYHYLSNGYRLLGAAVAKAVTL